MYSASGLERALFENFIFSFNTYLGFVMSREKTFGRTFWLVCITGSEWPVEIQTNVLRKITQWTKVWRFFRSLWILLYINRQMICFWTAINLLYPERTYTQLTQFWKQIILLKTCLLHLFYLVPVKSLARSTSIFEQLLFFHLTFSPTLHVFICLTRLWKSFKGWDIYLTCGYSVADVGVCVCLCVTLTSLLWVYKNKPSHNSAKSLTFKSSWFDL